MARKISYGQKERAWQMYYAKGYRVSEVAETMGLAYPTAWILTEGRRRGFKTKGEYLKHLAEQRGFSSLNEYGGHLLRGRGFRNYSEYAEYLVRRMGFRDYTRYQQYLAKQRQKEQPNKELGALITSRLEELGRTQGWLAGQIGVSHQTVSLYAQGKNIPRGQRLGKLLSALRVDGKSKRSLGGLISEG